MKKIIVKKKGNDDESAIWRTLVHKRVNKVNFQPGAYIYGIYSNIFLQRLIFPIYSFLCIIKIRDLKEKLDVISKINKRRLFNRV